MPKSNAEPSFERVTTRHLAAVTQGSVVPSSLRQRINSSLIRAGMDGNTRFQSPGMALSKASDVLSIFGIEWDEVIDSFQVHRPKGRMNVSLATQTDDPFSPVSIENTALAFHWDTLENGVEVIAYLG